MLTWPSSWIVWLVFLVYLVLTLSSVAGMFCCSLGSQFLGSVSEIWCSVCLPFLRSVVGIWCLAWPSSWFVRLGFVFWLGWLQVCGRLSMLSFFFSTQGKYECVASNSVGTEYSYSAQLYVRGECKNISVVSGHSYGSICILWICKPLPLHFEIECCHMNGDIELNLKIRR